MFLFSSETDLVQVLGISRAEVEGRDPSAALRWLNGLMVDRHSTWVNRASVALDISGYGSSKVDLWEVPEVCLFIRELHSHWKYWFHFGRQSEYAGLHPLTLLNLCIAGSDRKAPGAYEVDEWRCEEFAFECLCAFNQLYDKYNLPIDEKVRMLNGIYSYYLQAMGKDRADHYIMDNVEAGRNLD